MTEIQHYCYHTVAIAMRVALREKMGRVVAQKLPKMEGKKPIRAKLWGVQVELTKSKEGGLLVDGKDPLSWLDTMPEAAALQALEHCRFQYSQEYTWRDAWQGYVSRYCQKQ